MAQTRVTLEGMTMPIRVEAYTAGGILTGLIARSGSIRDVLEGSTAVAIGSSRWLPLDGSDEQASGEVELAVDDLILVVAEATGSAPVHAQWHSVELDAGPYRVNGEMPTMPGFDPGRALARPTGEFVVFRDARIRLLDVQDGGEASAPELLVNRYAVDSVTADLMLGFFFPGAAMTVTRSEEPPVLPVRATADTATPPGAETAKQPGAATETAPAEATHPPAESSPSAPA
jgi:hypothetical protein